MILVLASAVHAHTTVIAVGAAVYWREGCAAPDPVCEDVERALRYADDDAFRAAWLLSPFADPDHVHVLTRPDVSTAARTFPGGQPAAPSHRVLIETLDRTLSSGDERNTLVVYIAAHGTSEHIFFDDGVVSAEALKREITDRMGPKDELILIGDACLSGRWRNAEWGVPTVPAFGYPPVDASKEREVLIGAEGLVSEDGEAEGGQLTFLALSGLIGGADSDHDGVVLAQELSDDLHSRAAGLPIPLAPVVRAPRGLGTWPLPRPTRGGTLVLGRSVATRWRIATTDGSLLTEVFTRPDDVRGLALLAGNYLVEEASAAMDARGTWRLVPDAVRAWSVEVVEGTATVDLGMEHAVFRGATGQSVAGPNPLPPGWDRYHRSPVFTLHSGVVVEAGMLPDDRNLMGLQLELSGGPLGGMWLAAGGALQVPGGAWATQARTFSLSAGTSPRVVAGRNWAAGIRTGVQVTTAFLAKDDVTVATLGPGLVLGPSVAWAPRGSAWSVAGSAVWAPSIWLVDNDGASDATFTFDLSHAAVSLGMGVRL